MGKSILMASGATKQGFMDDDFGGYDNDTRGNLVHIPMG